MEGLPARAALLCLASASCVSASNCAHDVAPYRGNWHILAKTQEARHAGRNVRFSQCRRATRLPRCLTGRTAQMRAVALFAHCFTCGKDNQGGAAHRRGLKLHGIAVLRFDFTGLGASEGEFANTTFSSNVDDLVAAADHLRRRVAAPAILIGHSLGGAAVLAAAHRIAEARAVVTISAPCDPAHVAGLLGDHADEIRAEGEVEVKLAGRPFRIRRALLDDIAEQNLTARIATCARRCWSFMRRPTRPSASTMPAIFSRPQSTPRASSRSPAPIICSAAPGDAAYVAGVIAAWAERYLDMAADDSAPADDTAAGTVVVRETAARQISAGNHRRRASAARRRAGQGRRPGQRARSLRSAAGRRSAPARR